MLQIVNGVFFFHFNDVFYLTQFTQMYNQYKNYDRYLIFL